MRCHILAAAAFASTALCTNIPSILPIQAPNTTLVVSFGSITLSNPGRLLTKPQTTPQPVVALPSNNCLDTTDKTYLLLMVDPSINATDPSRVGLHEIVSGLHVSSNGTLISSATSQLAPYVYPQVPSGYAIHSYTLMLFQQPANLTIPSTYSSFLPYPTNLLTRVNFPVVDFIQQVGLGNPVAGNWFFEGAYNATGTSSASSSSVSSTSSATTSSSPATSSASSSTASVTSAPASTSTYTTVVTAPGGGVTSSTVTGIAPATATPTLATGAAVSARDGGFKQSLVAVLVPALALVGGVLLF